MTTEELLKNRSRKYWAKMLIPAQTSEPTAFLEVGALLFCHYYRSMGGVVLEIVFQQQDIPKHSNRKTLTCAIVSAAWARTVGV